MVLLAENSPLVSLTLLTVSFHFPFPSLSFDFSLRDKNT